MGFEIWPKSAKGDDSDRRILKGDGIVFDRRTFKGDDYWPKNDIIFGWVLTEDCYYGDDYYLKNALPLDFEGWPKSAKGDDLTEEFLKGKIIDWGMLYNCMIIDWRMILYMLCLTIAWRMFITYVCLMDRRRPRIWSYLKNNCKGAVWIWLKCIFKGADIYWRMFFFMYVCLMDLRRLRIRSCLKNNYKGAVWIWLKYIFKGADIYWRMLYIYIQLLTEEWYYGMIWTEYY